MDKGLGGGESNQPYGHDAYLKRCTLQVYQKFDRNELLISQQWHFICIYVCNCMYVYIYIYIYIYMCIYVPNLCLWQQYRFVCYLQWLVRVYNLEYQPPYEYVRFNHILYLPLCLLIRTLLLRRFLFCYICSFLFFYMVVCLYLCLIGWSTFYM
jgi:hypothetical protein